MRQLKHKQEQLLFLAEHDPLTNLLNRRAFDSKLDRAMQGAERKGSKLALLFIDLDDFKNRCGEGHHPLMNQIKAVLGPKMTADEEPARSQRFVFNIKVRIF